MVPDPRELTAAERTALRACYARGLYRAKNGYRIAGQSRLIKLATMSALEKRRLVRDQLGKSAPVVTGLGLNVLTLMDAKGLK